MHRRGWSHYHRDGTPKRRYPDRATAERVARDFGHEQRRSFWAYACSRGGWHIAAVRE